MLACEAFEGDPLPERHPLRHRYGLHLLVGRITGAQHHPVAHHLHRF